MNISKQCILCNKQFITNSKQNFNICNNNHIYYCKNCGKQIIITRNKNDWYKRNQIIKNGYVYCSNKCSIASNKEKSKNKYIDKYGQITIDSIRYKYEKTEMSKNDICKMFYITQYVLNNIIKCFEFKRNKLLVHKMYSNKSKQQYKNMTDEQKIKWIENVSKGNQKAWNNFTVEKRKEIKTKIKTTYSNNSKEIALKSLRTKINNNSYKKSKSEDR